MSVTRTPAPDWSGRMDLKTGRMRSACISL